MAGEVQATEEMSVAELAGLICRTGERLLSQHVELLRAELKQELGRVGGGLACMTGGAGLAAAGGLFSGLMLVHLLHRVTRLPLWSCYGVVAAGLGAAGAGLLQEGRQGLADVRLLPETAQAAQENLQWLKEQIAPNKE